MLDKVILHIGDKVTHSQWGEGIVTDADEEFCTIQFADKELTFRLPDAFENGFLTSEDAELIEDDWDDEEDEEDSEEDDECEEEEEEDEPDEEDEPETVSFASVPENKPDSSRLTSAILVGIVFIPIGITLIWVGIVFDFLLVTIIAVMFGVFCLAAPFMAYYIKDSLSGVSPTWQSSSSAPVYPVNPFKKKDTGISESERIRRDIYKMQDEELGILEDMQSMHLENPDADLEDHFGWEHKLEYDAEDVENSW